MRSLVYGVTAFLCLFLLSQAANAAPVDVSAVANGVFDQLLSLSLVGGAVLLVWAAVASLSYVRSVMGVPSGSQASPAITSSRPSVRGFETAQDYLDSLASRLAAEDAANGVEWRDVDSGKSNLDYEAEFRAEIEAAGSDPVLYDKYRLDDATHEEALRWSNKEANAEVKVPELGPGWSSGEIKMPVLGPGWK